MLSLKLSYENLVCISDFPILYVKQIFFLLCLVDRASSYNHVKKNQLHAQLILSILSNKDNRQPSKKNNKYQLLYTYGCTPLMMGLDTPETCRGGQNTVRISCASSWFFFTQHILSFNHYLSVSWRAQIVNCQLYFYRVLVTFL